MDEATATTATTVTATTVTATTVTATISSDRTKAERQAQVKPILEKLTELKLYASKFAAVKALMVQIQDYVANGEPQKVNIVFPEFGRRIKGTLETNRHVESSVKL
jgi:phosphopantetheine adenylyltransferase